MDIEKLYVSAALGDYGRMIEFKFTGDPKSINSHELLEILFRAFFDGTYRKCKVVKMSEPECIELAMKDAQTRCRYAFGGNDWWEVRSDRLSK